MISALMLALALGQGAPAAPSSAEIERMNHTFERTHEVWTATHRASFYVTGPRASEAGLQYQRTPGYPPRRPSVIAGNWDTIPAPPRPLPWSTIERIEWRHGGTGTGVLVGTLTGAAILAGVVATVNASGSDVGPSVPGVMLGAVAGGALAGMIASAVAAKTEVIYRAP